ncbi:polyadenylate-binding protein 1-like isoform X2 [Triplophysa dalaica]|uniref:polyadenylate-binding protein 1-like isoform X2 n=1 Tax=Triplophysa dalaica TaxID=1582913 RepID=UPI0024DFFFC5|nr:polyadenylate-binding protein 1-like isoform X2 [Triplophysa dalaica]
MTSFVGGSYCAAGVPRDQVASLFVGDLHPEVSELILHQTFSPFGPIQSVRVCRDRVTRRSLRYGYVNFVNLANESAMDNLMCQDLLGRPMRIMISQRDSTLRTTGVGNIFVKGLASSIDGARLHDSFSLFGKILSCKVVCDANGSKGYGFVHFATFEAAEKAIKALDGMLLDDQLVSIGHFKTFEERRVEPQVMAQDNERRYPGVSLYVCNLPYSFREQQLYRAFSPFGSIVSAKLMMEAGRSRGFGFVSFSTLEDATRAASVMNGRVVDGRALRVTLSRHNEQKTQTEKQDSSSESLPAGRFTSAVPQVQKRPDVHPENQPPLQHIGRQTAACVLAQGESLRPPMPVVPWDGINTRPPRLLVSLVLLEYWASQAELDVLLPMRLLGLPAPSDDTEVITHLSRIPKILPDSATAPVQTQAQQLVNSSHRSPSTWGRWFWMTLNRCSESRSLSCPTSWSIVNLQTTRRHLFFRQMDLWQNTPAEQDQREALMNTSKLFIVNNCT